MTDESCVSIDKLIKSRKSVRAFLKNPVPQEVLANLLEVASRAPSATNTQSWRVYVLTGAALKRAVDATCHAYDHESGQHTSEYQYTLAEYFEPYLSRRRKLGMSMYSLLGIKKENKELMRSQHRRNYEFFGAPVGLFFTIDRRLPMAWLIDHGAFFQNIMLSAKAHGLDTCLQTGWSDYHRIISRELKLGSDEMLVGGMSLGYADNDDPINNLITERAPVSEFVTFIQN